ncbi:hypothetical protein FRC08_006951 [Ceratobasidium sp. 394]|nr:hypothetical protein FRC08_006951 [Ceratobasidium sp. 394]
MLSPCLTLPEEILYLILLNLSVPHAAKLLTVKRAFFNAGIRVVWQRIDDINDLLVLLLNESPPSVQDDNSSIEVTIPDVISANTRARFDVYASCVRWLGTLGPRKRRYKIKWLGLDRLLTPTPITPALDTLILDSDSWLNLGLPSFYLTVTLFLGPATKYLCCSGHGSSALTFEQATLILAYAFDLGSPLTQLGLMVQEPETHRDLILALALSITKFDHLKSLALSALCAGSQLLDHISCLATLDALHLFNRPGGICSWSGSVASTNSRRYGFTSLRLFTTRGIKCEELGHFLSLHPSLLNNITELLIDIHYEGYRPSRDSIHQVFTILGSEARCLKDLTFVFSTFGVAGLEADIIRLDTLSCIFPLNLERLKLHSVYMKPTDFSALHDQWPRLTHFIMPHQTVGPADLCSLSRREALQVLGVGIRLGYPFDVGAMTALDKVRSSAAAIWLESEYMAGQSTPEVVAAFAR